MDQPLPSRESDTVEFKREWTRRALEDLAAFTNHKGGVLYLGVADDGTVLGWSANDTDLQRLANQVTETLGIRPRIEWERHEDKDVLVLRVSPTATPVSCRGRYYTRVSSTNREMTGEQLAAEFSSLSGTSWDSRVSEVSTSDVDDPTYQALVERGRERLPLLTSSPRATVLENLDLARDGHLTNAGVLLLTARPQREFARAELRVGKFENDEVVDTADIQGPLLAQFDGAVDALRKHLRVRFEVAPEDLDARSMERRDVWVYPVRALREAIANAIVHRDYTAIGHVQARVSNEGMRVWSPGGLPDEMTMEKLRDENHGSRPRNPVIAQVFYHVGIIEKWGTGTTLMLRACRESGLPEPEFTETGGGFEVHFLQDPFTPERLAEAGWSDRHIGIVSHVKEHGQVNNREVRALLGVSARTGSRLLNELAEGGILARRGSTRDAHYVIVSPRRSR